MTVASRMSAGTRLLGILEDSHVEDEAAMYIVEDGAVQLEHL